MVQRLRTAAAVLAALLLVGVVPPAAWAVELPTTSTSTTAPPAERRDAIASELSELEESLEEVEAEEAALQGDLEETQSARASLDAEVAELDAAVGAARADLAQREAALDAAVAEDLRSQRRLEDATRELRTARRRLSDQAVTAFIHLGARRPAMDVHFSVGDLHELRRARVLAGAVAEAQAETVGRYHELRDRSERLEAEAVRARAGADQQRDEVVRRNAEVEELHLAMTTARAELADQADREATLLVAARQRKGAFEARVASLQQESDAITSLLLDRQRSADEVPGPPTIVPVGDGSFGAPLVNPRVTSRFGYRIHPIYGTRRLHAGVDFGAPTGTPILAAADGVVAFAGVRGGYGNTVILEHGRSLATLYAHQSRIAVAPGARVVRGQVIGYVGSTGASTGPHLHFEVRLDGRPVDPLGYL